MENPVTVQVVVVTWFLNAFLVLTVIREILTLLTILHLEIAKTFLVPAALSNLTHLSFYVGLCLSRPTWVCPLQQL